MVALAITPLCSKDTKHKVYPYTVSFSQGQQNLVKLRLSEKHTKFGKIFLMVLKNQLIYLVNVKTRRFFLIICASQKVRTVHVALS